MRIEARHHQSGPAPSRPAVRARRGGGGASFFLLFPVVAFWVGVMILFLGAAGAAGWQFLAGVLRARGALETLAPIYLLWLLLALFFFSGGMIIGVLVWLLLRRRLLGYYASLLAALGLLFLGPVISLIPAQPDYLITVTLALLPTTVILLTLSSGMAFDKQ